MKYSKELKKKTCHEFVGDQNNQTKKPIIRCSNYYLLGAVIIIG